MRPVPPILTDDEPLDPGVPPKDAARILGHDVSTIYKMVRRQQLRAYKSGRCLRIFASSIRQRQMQGIVGTEPLALPADRRQPKPSGSAHRAAMDSLRAMGLRV